MYKNLIGAWERVTSARSAVGRSIPIGWFGARLIGIGIGFVLWYWLATIFPNQLMPYPLEVIGLAWELALQSSTWPHIQSTLWLTLWSFVIAFGVSIVAGLALGATEFGEEYLTPWVSIGLSLPLVGVAAALIVINGINQVTTVLASVIVLIPFVVIPIWKGAENINMDLIKMSRSFELSYLRMISRVILPSIAPALFSAGRIGIALSWKNVVVVESIAARRGVGERIFSLYQGYQFEQAWAWAILFMALVFIFEYLVVRPFRRKVFDYRPDADLDRIA